MYRRFILFVWGLTMAAGIAAVSVWVTARMVRAITRPEFPPRAERRSDLADDELSTDALIRRFHRVDLQPGRDLHSTCVGCHGSIPHTRDAATRSYNNMHGSVVACQTCHVLPEAGPVAFVWYRSADGAEVGNPDMAGVPKGEYGAVLLPKGADGARIDSGDKAALERYNSQVRWAGPKKAADANDLLHASVTAEPLGCAACHSAEPHIPYEEVGYPAERARELRDPALGGVAGPHAKKFLPPPR